MEKCKDCGREFYGDRCRCGYSTSNENVRKIAGHDSNKNCSVCNKSGVGSNVILYSDFIDDNGKRQPKEWACDKCCEEHDKFFNPISAYNRLKKLGGDPDSHGFIVHPRPISENLKSYFNRVGVIEKLSKYIQ